jgi:hypothetical protein
MIRVIITTAAICLAVSACGPQRPAIDPRLESGVTSSNGGGQRATGAVPDLTIGPRGATTTGTPTSAGAAY